MATAGVKLSRALATRTRRSIDQLELQLEELAAAMGEDEAERRALRCRASRGV
jgi:hypothetical protein